ncbi:septal ring lytic transglycosylase RlpA family protein [Flectobacillus major]|jgi:rare lipoprotein A|uniref:septal ring lytic transglycosylase RlpA family protein n=1 Tax=Flectobacillus major TaxID=103 RepID=UPI0005C77191|nr:septal ring lytic transglycosylase RlpA family protein [Flectobacillus major]
MVKSIFLLILCSVISLAVLAKDETSFQGKASFYAKKFNGRRTTSGERYKNNDFTAAHRSLPFGTLLEVTNKSNGKTAIVRVNDRGPHRKKIALDLSYAAAKKIGIVRKGIGTVVFKVVSEQNIDDSMVARANN